MLAAATSSRPAVTRRAYECGGVDVDGDGIVRQSAERERRGGGTTPLPRVATGASSSKKREYE